jgi:hypothetical protein
MAARTFAILSRLLLVVSALSGGIALVGAQSPSPNSTLAPQKMKRTTNEERKAAAARNAERRAKARNKATVPASQSEVKQ